MDASTVERELRAAQIETALREFVSEINSAGGIIDDDGKRLYPVGAPEWPDLAPLYCRACEALGLVPEIEYE